MTKAIRRALFCFNSEYILIDYGIKQGGEHYKELGQPLAEGIACEHEEAGHYADIILEFARGVVTGEGYLILTGLLGEHKLIVLSDDLGSVSASLSARIYDLRVRVPPSTLMQLKQPPILLCLVCSQSEPFQ